MSRKTTDHLIKTLSAAYQARVQKTGPDDKQWRQNVMRSIRQVGQKNGKEKGLFFSGQMAWRLAPVALVLMIIMAVMIIQVDNSIEFQMASLDVSDPIQPYLSFTPF